MKSEGSLRKFIPSDKSLTENEDILDIIKSLRTINSKYTIQEAYNQTAQYLDTSLDISPLFSSPVSKTKCQSCGFSLNRSVHVIKHPLWRDYIICVNCMKSPKCVCCERRNGTKSFYIHYKKKLGKFKLRRIGNHTNRAPLYICSHCCSVGVIERPKDIPMSPILQFFTNYFNLSFNWLPQSSFFVIKKDDCVPPENSKNIPIILCDIHDLCIPRGNSWQSQKVSWAEHLIFGKCHCVRHSSKTSNQDDQKIEFTKHSFIRVMSEKKYTLFAKNIKMCDVPKNPVYSTEALIKKPIVNEPSKDFKERISKLLTVKNIFLVSCLPHCVTIATLLHEMVHAYLFLSDKKLNYQVEEGLCNAVSLCYLLSDIQSISRQIKKIKHAINNCILPENNFDVKEDSSITKIISNTYPEEYSQFQLCMTTNSCKNDHSKSKGKNFIYFCEQSKLTILELCLEKLILRYNLSKFRFMRITYGDSVQHIAATLILPFLLKHDFKKILELLIIKKD